MKNLLFVNNNTFLSKLLTTVLLLLLFPVQCICFIPTSSTSYHKVSISAFSYDSRIHSYSYANSNIYTKLALSSTELTSNNDDNDNDDEKLQNISKPPDGIELGSHEELMYALGINLARQLGDITPLVENGTELAQVAKGLLDTIVGRLTEDGQRELLARRGNDLNTLITDRAQKIRDVLAQAGREMLNEMAQSPGAITLESGVVIQLLESGPIGSTRPTKASTVQIHYHGTLADGTIFDSTLGKEPVKFPLAAVIPGWRDAVLKMHQGDIAMVGIPPEQAYGIDGTPDGRIPGGSTLFFKIELLTVLSAGISGEAVSLLLGADGKQLSKQSKGTTLLGPDGKALF